MEEYISREETVKAFCEKCKGYYDGHCIHRGECDIDVIKTAPAADVQPVKHGHWEEEDTMPYDNFVVCSECGMNLSYQNYTKEEWQESFRYCPCCGARMDGDI